MHLPKEFYCWELPRGMIIFGTFTTVLHSICLCNSIYVYSSRNQTESNATSQEKHISFGHTTIYFIAWSILEIIVNALLIRGIMKKAWKMLLPWLVLYVILLIKIALLNMVFYGFITSSIFSLSKAQVFEASLVVEFLFLILFAFICYPFICVLSLYRRFKSNNLSCTIDELDLDNGYSAKDAE